MLRFLSKVGRPGRPPEGAPEEQGPADKQSREKIPEVEGLQHRAWPRIVADVPAKHGSRGYLACALYPLAQAM